MRTLAFKVGGAEHRTRLGQRLVAVDIVERDSTTSPPGELDEPPRDLRRHGLPTLVVTDVALRTADSIGQNLLRHA